MQVKSKTEFEFSMHALEQREARGISKRSVEKVLNKPEQVKVEDGKLVFQSIIEKGKSLIRIFVNSNKDPKLIITVYKTSKIHKYYESKIR